MKLVLLGTTGYHPNDRRHTPCMVLPECGIALDAGTSMYRLGRYLQQLRSLRAEYRGARSRANSQFTRRRERHGALIIHLGVVMISIGIAGSSGFQAEKEAVLHKNLVDPRPLLRAKAFIN